MILPFNLASLLLRLLIDNYPEAMTDSESSVHLICISLQYFYVTWISPWYYMSFTAVVFRLVVNVQNIQNSRFWVILDIRRIKILCQNIYGGKLGKDNEF